MPRGVETVQAYSVTDIAINNTHGTPSTPLGSIFEDPSGKRYRFFQMHTVLINDAASAGEVLVWQAKAYVATQDVSAGLGYDSTNSAHAAGFSLAAFPESTATTTAYAWLQISGFIDDAKVDTGADAANESCYPDPSVDTKLLSLGADASTMVFNKVCAHTLEADTAGVADMIIHCPVGT